MRHFSSKGKWFRCPQCKLHFDSMHGELDTPYGSNNMKIDKGGFLQF